MAAAHHDVPEAILGDLPAPIKRLLSEAAPGVFGQLEERMRAASGIPDYGAALTEEETLALKLADRLEGAMFSAHEVFGMGNHSLLGVYHGYREYLLELMGAGPLSTQPLCDRARELMSIIDQMYLTVEDTEYVVFG